jgi:hypothetical protein
LTIMMLFCLPIIQSVWVRFFRGQMVVWVASNGRLSQMAIYKDVRVSFAFQPAVKHPFCQFPKAELTKRQFAKDRPIFTAITIYSILPPPIQVLVLLITLLFPSTSLHHHQ